MDTTLSSLGEKDLASRTIASLRAYFDIQCHHPSAPHWEALQAIADTMQAMVIGDCRPAIYLSPCDPGVGKSRTVIHFARELVADQLHRNAGLFISVFTIAEAKAMAEALHDISNSLCVLTSDAEANAMGAAPDANSAQVLITTQNRLGRLTADRPFAAATAFHYQGKPRDCRVWDESVLPGSVIVINADALMGMASRLRALSPSLTNALYQFGAELLRTEDAAAIDVPDFASLCDVSLYDVTAYLAADNGTTVRERDREVALALLVVNGRRVRVRIDGLNGAAMLTFREELPADLMPMLVLDASGRVRQTYALWRDRPGSQSIVMLPSAIRDYSPLTVKVWKAAGSKSGWQRNGSKLMAGIVATIQTKPDQEWLVVLHKPNGQIGDLKKTLMAALPAGLRDRVSVTTWGQHTGSNEWTNVPNVILAGTLFYPDSHLTGLHHLCANLPVADGLASREDIEQTARGEHRHLILQAICRGRVRRSDGHQCQAMTAHVIAAPRSGIPTELDTIFPGCVVESWSPVKVEARGKLGEAIAYITSAIEGGSWAVTYPEVYAALGMHKANFARSVGRTELWKAAVIDLEAEITTGPRGVRMVRALSNAERELSMAA